MASELKPWRYEIKYGPDGEDGYSWVYDDHGVMVAPMRTHKAKEIVDRMNTRPAPAATDTGLETVGYVTPEWLAKHCSAHTITAQPTPAWTEAVVTRSQAEALLAAERAEHDNTIATLTSLITDNAAKDKLIQSLIDFDSEEVKRLEADNAAQAARIKELDRCHEGTIDLCNQKTARIKELEADLKTYQDGTADLVNEKIDAEFKAVDLEAKLEAAEKRAKTAERYLEEAKRQTRTARETADGWREAAFKRRDECDELRREHELLETRFAEVDHDRRGFQADALSWKQAFAAQSYKLHAALRAGDERVREAVRRAAEELRHGG